MVEKNGLAYSQRTYIYIDRNSLTPHACIHHTHVYVYKSYMHAYDNSRKVWITLENLYDNFLVHCHDRSNR